MSSRRPLHGQQAGSAPAARTAASARPAADAAMTDRAAGRVSPG